MYPTILALHSWLRWLTLILAVAATLNAARPLSPDGAPPRGRWWDSLLMLAVDVQLLAGLMLFFGVSPFTTQGLADLGVALRNPVLRFWTLEHPAAMFAALILIRVGRVLAMRAGTPDAARKRRLACFAAATVIMLAATPWPGLMNGRPLFRL